MTSGERRLAERLEQKLEDDYLLWYDVPVGTRGFHPDFMVLHPRRGLAVLEVKDWRIDTIQRIDKSTATLLTNRGLVHAQNPFEQGRIYAQAVVGRLQKDPALQIPGEERYGGKLCLPWTHGVVMTNITRRQFESTDLDEVMPPTRVICKDEMVESIDSESFQKRLWEMFPWILDSALSLPQIDRIRWHLFPEVRITAPEQMGLFEGKDSPERLPDLIRIMDLQQEQLARSLGEGHRVIHGVAGSGKTMILGYRCLHLAKVLRNKPILVLCYNRTLAERLRALVTERGIQDKVMVHNFHAWCLAQLKQYHVDPPPSSGPKETFYEQLIQFLIRALDRRQVPRAQYGAVLIDEGHDFRPEWLKLVVQMLDPETNSLLLLYDDAQSIYSDSENRRNVSLKSLGIQAQGRTTILRLNYRNTAEVLRVAYDFAQEVLTPMEASEDGIPVLRPESAERHGPMPELIQLPSLDKELEYLTGRFTELNAEGMPWREMAIVYRDVQVGRPLVEQLKRKHIPVQWATSPGQRKQLNLDQDTVKVITIHSSKGLEFPVVAIPGIGRLPGENRDEQEESRLLYVGMTRAMDRLILTCDRESPFVDKLGRTPVKQQCLK